MISKRGAIRAGGLVLAVGALWVVQDRLDNSLDAAQMQAPMFQVDPFWPQPMPNNWLLGSTIGAWVDDQDRIWIVHRQNLTGGEAGRVDGGAECCIPAPPILAFDLDGNVVKSWGPAAGEQYQGIPWPESNHGIFVDHEGFVWVGGNGGGDSHILKLTEDGEVVQMFGRQGARSDGQGGYIPNSNDTEAFGRVAKIFVDEETNEVYLADGYLNQRVAVLDQESGRVVRHWAAYGNRPDDDFVHPERTQASIEGEPSQQFRGPTHCADVSVDRLVYVCDRASNRIQIFTPEGEFVSEHFFATDPLWGPSTWDVAFSPDDEQTYIYVPDGSNQRVRVVLRETMEELYSFGMGGRYPGQFFGAHSIATDSEGNIYTTETYEGKRIQKFAYMGMGPVRERVLGPTWPSD